MVICPQYPPSTAGGLAEYAQRSLRHLRQQRGDLRVTLHTLDFPGEHERRSMCDGMEVIRPRMPRWLKAGLATRSPSLRDYACFALAVLIFNAGALADIWRARRSDLLVAAHDWQSTPAGILAWLLWRTPVIYHVHNTEVTMMPRAEITDPMIRLIRIFQRLMGKVATLTIVPTPEMKELLVREGWAADRLRVIPHGHDADAAGTTLPDSVERAAARNRLLTALGFSADTQLLVFAGRLSPVKGIHRLLSAMPQVIERHPRARLLVLGVGLPGTDQDAVVDRLVADLDIDGHALVYHRYLPQPQVRQHFLAADICVFPSSYESFGLVAIEAMSLGVPVVVGRGFTRTIALGPDGQTAFRLTRDDPAELSTMINSVLDDPAHAAMVGARGLRHIRHSFSWQACAEATLAAYDEAVGVARPQQSQSEARRL
jgi:glycosyltransferase involved in cell wall biosynthesis